MCGHSNGAGQVKTGVSTLGCFLVKLAEKSRACEESSTTCALWYSPKQIWVQNLPLAAIEQQVGSYPRNHIQAIWRQVLGRTPWNCLSKVPLIYLKPARYFYLENTIKVEIKGTSRPKSAGKVKLRYTLTLQRRKLFLWAETCHDLAS